MEGELGRELCIHKYSLSMPPCFHTNLSYILLKIFLIHRIGSVVVEALDLKKVHGLILTVLLIGLK